MFFQSGSKNIAKDIEYISSLMFEVLKMPVHFLDNNQDIFISFSHGYGINPLYKNINDIFRELFPPNDISDFPIVKTTKYNENYFSIKLNKNDIFLGTFIVGPSIFSNIGAESIDAISCKKDLVNYYNSVTIMDYNKLLSSSILFYYCIYNKKLSLKEVVNGNSNINDITLNIKNNLDNNLSKGRQELIFHHSQAKEKIMIQCIKTGNKEKLAEYFENPSDGESGILSRNNPLRGHKNLMICLVTIATRAAIEGGLDSEISYSLSDLYIQKIEEINEIRDLSALQAKIIFDFTDRVSNLNTQKYSTCINQCISYIFKHLYEKISMSELAESVALNPNYLSELFKKEVGVTISYYIQKEKIEESKRLLVASTYSILDISNWLNFHDQSHFTRVFSKLTGTTPKKYRCWCQSLDK